MIKLTCYKQSDSSLCGPASVRTILAYHGINATEKAIARRCNHSFQRGCTNQGIVNALESYGLIANMSNNNSIDILRQQTRRTPVIVDWFTGGVTPNGHASVCVGVDRKHVFIADPEIGQVRQIAINDWNRIWFDWTGMATTPIDQGNLNVRTIITAFPKNDIRSIISGVLDKRT